MRCQCHRLSYVNNTALFIDVMTSFVRRTRRRTVDTHPARDEDNDEIYNEILAAHSHSA